MEHGDNDKRMLKELKKTILHPDLFECLVQKQDKELESILMNKKRQQILQFLFRCPCMHLHGIARNFGFSINTTRWHLRKLMNVGYLDQYPLGNKKVYFPFNSLNELDITILGLLNNDKLGSLFIKISHTPGITQKEICEQLSEKQTTMVDRLTLLEHHELIYTKKDGLYRRYYPTTVIGTRERLSREQLTGYRRFLIEVLKRDGMEPEILRTTDKKLYIRIKSGRDESDLIFYFNPYERFLD